MKGLGKYLVESLGLAAGFLFLGSVAGSGAADLSGRLATAVEQAFQRETMELLAAALPADVPEGWEITGQSEIDELEYVGRKTGTASMEVEYSLEWANVSVQQQAEERAMAQFAEVVDSSPVSEAQIAEYEGLAAKVAEAAAADDLAQVEALQQQMELQAAMLNSAFADVDRKIVEINRAATAPDSHVVMTLVANRLQQPVAPEDKKIIVAGYPALQTPGHYLASGEWREAVTSVFMGEGWSLTPDNGAYRFAGAGDRPHTSLQTVVLVLEADPARVASLVATIDWQTLQSALEGTVQ